MRWNPAYSSSPPELGSFLADGGNSSSVFFAQTITGDLGLWSPGVFWLLYLISEREQEGHTAHPWAQLELRWTELWGEGLSEAGKLGDLNKEKSWSELFLHPDLAGEAPLWYLPGKECFYLEKDWALEQGLVKAVARRLKRAKGMVNEGPNKPTEHTPDWEAFWRRSDYGKLDPGQKAAVEGAFGKSLFVLSGGPGTGKTTTLRAILDCALQLDDLQSSEIALLAPTGRAAQRMAESLAGEKVESSAQIENLIGLLKPTTIQRQLGLRVFRNASVHYNGRTRLPHRLVVVDEASMLDLRLFGMLLEALEDDCRLILVGDKDQLPSVDSGAVLRDLLLVLEAWPHGAEHHAFLTKVFRSKRAVVEAARAIAHYPSSGVAKSSGDRLPPSFPSPETSRKNSPAYGQLEMFNDPPEILQGWAELAEEGFTYHQGLPEEGPRALADLLWDKLDFESLSTKAQDLPKDYWDTDKLQHLLEGGILLSSHRVGLWGSRYLNQCFMEKRGGGQPSKLPPAGTPVLITANDSALGIYNGDRGLLVHGEEGGNSRRPMVLFAAKSEVRSVPLGLIQAWQPGWAMTIHKAQGSEYAKVAVLLPPNQAGHLNREILYTGITRAKEHCWLWSDEQTVLQALENQTQEGFWDSAGDPFNP
jgi:exodeoxyribonuclease V alpha subunit